VKTSILVLAGVVCAVMTGCVPDVPDANVYVETSKRCRAIGGDRLEAPQDTPVVAVRVKGDPTILECVRREPNERKIVAIYVISGEVGKRVWDERLAKR
jgi:hypothetical protein